MDLESVLEFLRANTDQMSEKHRRLSMAVEYAIKLRDADKMRISILEQAIVARFLKDSNE